MAARKTPKPKVPKSNARIWFFVGFSLLALYLANLIPTLSKTKIIPYSEFREAIKSGSLDEVLIGNEFLEGGKKNSQDRIVTLRVEDKDLVSLLEDKKIRYEARAESNWLKDFFFTWVLPLIFIFFIWQFVIGRMFKSGPPGIMAFGKSRAKLVADTQNNTTFKDVAGVDEAKEELQEVIDFLKKPQKFKEIGGRIPKGVLLVGPPGTGKTLLARAVAGEAGVAFFQISGSDFVEMFVGVGAARVRDLFREAEKSSPCIIFIDELDAIAKTRSTGMFQTNDEREQTLNQILVEMDGFDNHAGIILVAATNRPEVLDPAILRPGRFDRQITVDRPDIKGREAILKVHSKNVKVSQDVDYKKIAARTPGMSGADLANVVNEAALLAVRKGLTEANRECFEEAIDRVIAGLARKSRVINENEKHTIAIHELGHALVAYFTEGADKVHRISIVPRTSGALGFTMQIPEEERSLVTKNQMKGILRVLLGGRAAESVLKGDVTTGAQDDLRRASALVRRMIMEFGMGDSLGLVSLSNNGPGYLENPFLRDDRLPVSEEVAQKIDREVRKILDQEFEVACTIIRNNRALIEVLTKKLLEKETIEGEDFIKSISESVA